MLELVLFCLLSGVIVIKWFSSVHWACSYSAGKAMQFWEVGHFWSGVALAPGQPDLRDLYLELTGSRHVQVALASSDSQSKLAVQVLLSAEVYSEHR